MNLSVGDELPSLPRHVAIIMDGNGRWACQKGPPRSEGHRAGAKSARMVVEECRRLGIGHLTLYAFSSENWKRPPAEIATLFGLLLEFLHNETPRMIEQGIRLQALGDLEGMPAAQRAALKLAMARTANCNDMVLNLALNYGGRAELVRAVREILASSLKAEEITEEKLASFLYTAGQPDPDLLIRTSGELRLSNFLPFQTTYSELYFTSTLWPDFDKSELLAALRAFGQRQRRFGSADAAKTREGVDCNGS